MFIYRLKSVDQRKYKFLVQLSIKILRIVKASILLEETRAIQKLVLITSDLLSGTFATVSKYVTVENIYNNAYS